MKAIVFEEKGRWGLKDVSVPKVGVDEVLIKVDSCGICGTDVHIYEGVFPANFPLIPGHEFAGMVEEVGEGVKDFKIGDRVTVNPNLACEKCRYCRKGQQHLCLLPTRLGVTTDGGFAEYVKAKEVVVYHLPEKLDLELASFAEPLSCCIHGVDLAQIKTGNSVVILGAGPIGLLILQLVRISGADRVVITDTIEKRRKLALQLGANLALDPSRADVEREVENFLRGKAEVVMECVGTLQTEEQSLKLVEPGGTVIWFGVADPKTRVRINPFYIYENEITIKGSFVNPYTMERAIRLLAEGRIRARELITHRFGLDKFGEAIRAYREDADRVKILIKP